MKIQDIDDSNLKKRTFPKKKREKQVSLIGHLQSTKDASLRALDFISKANVSLRFPSLCISTLVFYYGKHSRKTDITKNWKRITRIEKIRLSALKWIELLGLNQHDQNEFTNVIIDLISTSWSRRRSSNKENV